MDVRQAQHLAQESARTAFGNDESPRWPPAGLDLVQIRFEDMIEVVDGIDNREGDVNVRNSIFS